MPLLFRGERDAVGLGAGGDDDGGNDEGGRGEGAHGLGVAQMTASCAPRIYGALAAISTPHWYAKPGKNPRSGPGESSLMCAGITPHAPCTMNCIRNAPSASSATDGAKTHKRNHQQREDHGSDHGAAPAVVVGI